VIKSSLSINQTTKNWMKAKINTHEIEANIIKIDYIKPRHEGVQLLIEYYNAIPTTFTHKIYTKSTSLVPHKPYSTLLLHCGTSTHWLEWRPKVFIYRNFWVVLSPTFDALPYGLLHKWISFSTQLLVSVLSTWHFLLKKVFLAAQPNGFGL